MTDIDRIALARDHAMRLRPDWSPERATAYAEAVVARDDAIANLRASLTGVTMDDLTAEAEEIRNEGGSPEGDVWGLDSVDWDGLMAERNAADEQRKAVAEYEADPAYQAREAMRQSFLRDNPGKSYDEALALLPESNHPSRKTAAAKPKAPAAPADPFTHGAVLTDIERMEAELAPLREKYGIE